MTHTEDGGSVREYLEGRDYQENTIDASEQIITYQDPGSFTGGVNTACLSAAGDTTLQQGIRYEQLCEILSRELSRVREESYQQAYEMRMQYEIELQALRQEFFNKNSLRHTQQTSKTTSGQLSMHE